MHVPHFQLEEMFSGAQQELEERTEQLKATTHTLLVTEKQFCETKKVPIVVIIIVLYTSDSVLS